MWGWWSIYSTQMYAHTHTKNAHVHARVVYLHVYVAFTMARTTNIVRDTHMRHILYGLYKPHFVFMGFYLFALFGLTYQRIVEIRLKTERSKNRTFFYQMSIDLTNEKSVVVESTPPQPFYPFLYIFVFFFIKYIFKMGGWGGQVCTFNQHIFKICQIWLS